MNVMEWSKSNVDYGRKLVDSALEGARTGESEFLKEESLTPHFSASPLGKRWPLPLLARVLGALGGYLRPGDAPEPEPSSVAYSVEQSVSALA